MKKNLKWRFRVWSEKNVHTYTQFQKEIFPVNLIMKNFGIWINSFYKKSDFFYQTLYLGSKDWRIEEIKIKPDQKTCHFQSVSSWLHTFKLQSSWLLWFLSFCFGDFFGACFTENLAESEPISKCRVSTFWIIRDLLRRGSLPGGKGGDKGGVITKGKGVTKMKLTPTAKYSMCRPYMLAAKLYLHEGNKRKQHVVHNF